MFFFFQNFENWHIFKWECGFIRVTTTSLVNWCYIINQKDSLLWLFPHFCWLYFYKVSNLLYQVRWRPGITRLEDIVTRLWTFTAGDFTHSCQTWAGRRERPWESPPAAWGTRLRWSVWWGTHKTQKKVGQNLHFIGQILVIWAIKANFGSKNVFFLW